MKRPRVDLRAAALFSPTRASSRPSWLTTAARIADDAAFSLDLAFVRAWEDETPPFGFNGLGELVFLRTYSRARPEAGGLPERWCDTVERVVNGTFRLQQRHCAAAALPWDAARAQSEVGGPSAAGLDGGAASQSLESAQPLHRSCRGSIAFELGARRKTTLRFEVNGRANVPLL